MNVAVLAEALDVVERHDPVEVDGCEVSLTARPPDADGLAATLRIASRHGAAVIPRGGATRLGFGNPPRRSDLLLDTRALGGILTLDASEGVCEVGAGTTLGALREALADTVWELPLDAPDASTVGGVLATAAAGPRSHGYGLPRDVVLGLSVVQASGTPTRCGGRVVKNVTGYDMAKLYTGSLGTLGIITSAWLRLRPTPAAVEVRELELPAVDAASRGIEIARGHAVRACVLASAGEVHRCVVELAGDEASVRESAVRLEREYAARPSAPDAIDAARRRQTESHPDRARFRIGTGASRLGATLAALARAGVGTLAYPGPGLVYALFEPDQLEGAFAVASDAAAGRDYCCEAAPADRKRGHDVFGNVGAALSLMRALKECFDPEGILNPGRFAGGL